jgi:NADH-quinone oxidoreductase subunit G
VQRLRPRENRGVNGWWMCDEGRHDFHYINDKRRVLCCKVGGKDDLDIQGVTEKVGARLKEFAKADPQSVACLASAWLTLEELHALGSKQIGVLAQPATKDEVFPQFTIEADKNPDRAGAKLVLGSDVEAETARIIEGINAGRIKALYLVSGMPHFTPPPELLAALKKLEYLVVQDLLPGPLTEIAHVLLPSVTFAEKDGIFVNSHGHAQLLQRAIDPLPQGHDDLTIIQRVLRGTGVSDIKLASAREVFRQMSAACALLAALTHQTLGHKGVVLPRVSSDT